MRPASLLLLALGIAPLALAQGGLTLPKTVVAGSSFSIPTSGNGNATLYIVGPEQVLKRDVQLGQSVLFAEGTLYNAGHYIAYLSGGSNDSGQFDVVSADKPAKLSLLARPSRLPVGLRNGITGAVYVLDSYENLITTPTQVTFQLSTPGSTEQSRTVSTREGAAWIAVDSSPKEGAAHFIARAGDISATRIIGQVPGDPCTLQMTAKPNGENLELETAPVRDCSGNAIPDGTVVTFTQTFEGGQSTVDVPIKRGIAKVEMPAHPGSTITVASGVVLGNQIRWGR